MKLIDPDHPFYAPLWRRVVLLAVLAGWALLEFTTGAPILGFVLAALSLYCLNVLFLTFDPKTETETDTSTDTGEDS